ncbi:MAG: hypothetical protein KC620_11200, partial [Myxococcales bacterium]|nr:hypothetical protein [Myxococcales bacterium]
MSNQTLILLILALVALVLDIFVPSGGVLSGAAIAVVIERALAAAGVAAVVRIPLAAVGMVITVVIAIRFGERISERFAPLKARTNADRLRGLVGRVHRVDAEALVVELEGDLWNARLAEGAAPVQAGQRV